MSSLLDDLTENVAGSGSVINCVCSVCISPDVSNVLHSSYVYRWEQYLLTRHVALLRHSSMAPSSRVPVQKPSSTLLLVWRWLWRWAWCLAVCSGSQVARYASVHTSVAVWITQTMIYQQTVVPPMRQQTWSTSAWDETEQLSLACSDWTEQALGGEMRWPLPTQVGVQAQHRCGLHRTETPPSYVTVCVCVCKTVPANGIHGHLFI